VIRISTIARRRLALVGAVGLLILAVGVARSALSGGNGGSARVTAPAPKPAQPRVALQVGHWQHEKLPRELQWVRRSAGGTASAGTVEWQVNLAIAREAQRLLEAQSLAVDLLPATVPPGYRAAAFVSIHTDGNDDPTVTGFKVAPAARDRSGLARTLNESLARRYAERTALSWNTGITPDMTSYYAFDERRFRHAINPATPAVVLETGFLTNPDDRRIIVDAPQLAAQGIANGVLDFLRDPRPSA